MSNKWINNLARLIKYEKNNKAGYFLIFERPKDKNKKYIGESPFPITINEGDTFQAKLKADDLQRLVDEGKMSQDTADSICKHVKFEFSKAPSQSSGGTQSNNDSNDEVDF